MLKLLVFCLVVKGDACTAAARCDFVIEVDVAALTTPSKGARKSLGAAPASLTSAKDVEERLARASELREAALSATKDKASVASGRGRRLSASQQQLAKQQLETLEARLGAAAAAAGRLSRTT